MAEEIRQRVSVEDAATEELRGVANSVTELERVSDDATEASETRKQEIGRLKTTLHDLIEEEDDYQQAVKAGNRLSGEADEASEARRKKIEEVAGRLAAQEDAQARVNAQSEAAVGAYRRVAEGGQDVADTSGNMSTGFGGMAQSLRDMLPLLIGSGSLGAALSVVRKEFQQILDQQDEARRVSIDQASAVRSLRFNMFSAQDRIPEALGFVEELSTETGVRQATLIEAMGSSFSAAQGDFDAAKNRVAIAARARPDKPGLIAPIAAAIGDTAGALGTETDEQAFGALLTLQGLVRPDDFGQLATNAPAGLRALVNLGFKPEESIALFGALTEASTDTSGATSASAAANFAEQFDTFLGEQGIEARGFEAIRQVQEQGIGDEFFESLSVEVKSKDFFRGLFARGSESAESQAIERNLSQVPGIEELGQQANEFLSTLEQGLAEQVAAAERQLETATEGILLNDPEGAMAAVVREGIPNLLAAAGQSAITGELQQLLADVGTDHGREQVFERVKHRIRIQQEKMRMPQIKGGFPGVDFEQPDERTLENIERLDTVIELIDVIQERFQTAQEQEQAREERERNRTKLPLRRSRRTQPEPAPPEDDADATEQRDDRTPESGTEPEATAEQDNVEASETAQPAEAGRVEVTDAPPSEGRRDVTVTEAPPPSDPSPVDVSEPAPPESSNRVETTEAPPAADASSVEVTEPADPEQRRPVEVSEPNSQSPSERRNTGDEASPTRNAPPEEADAQARVGRDGERIVYVTENHSHYHDNRVMNTNYGTVSAGAKDPFTGDLDRRVTL